MLKSKLRIQAEMRWGAILSGVEEGDHPKRDELANAVEYYPMSAEARKYVAAWIRGDVDLGAGGAPRKKTLDLLRESLLEDHVERLRERYARERQNQPRNEDIHERGSQARRKCVQHTLALMEKCPTCGFVRVLLDARNVAGGWAPTKDGRWKIRRPREYAIRHAALELGVSPATLSRRIKEWRDVGRKKFLECIKRERKAHRRQWQD